MASVVDLLVQILSDPLSIVLLLTGAVLVGVSVAVFGVLALGAVLDLVTPEPKGPPRRD